MARKSPTAGLEARGRQALSHFTEAGLLASSAATTFHRHETSSLGELNSLSEVTGLDY